MPSDSEIKTYWNRKAEQLGVDASATMKDVVLRSLEIESISSRLDSEDRLLDIGCGNAFGSIQFAQQCKSVLAVDYSEGMISAASRAIQESGRNNVHTTQGNVLTIGDSYHEEFTAASSVRCLINLPTDDQQYTAIAQIAKTLVAGGRLFLVEGIASNFAAMNDMRQQVGLPTITLDWHNRLFPKGALETELKRWFVIEEIVDFGEYYFLSRIMHPLLVAPEEPTFLGKPNLVASNIWRSRVLAARLADISTLLLYVCRKS